MGELLDFPHEEGIKEFYPPVDPHNPKDCLLLHCEDVPGIVGVMIVRGLRFEYGAHAIKTPDSNGWIVRNIELSGHIAIITALSYPYTRHIYAVKDVTIVGAAIQFIRSWESGERWELIHGAAISAEQIPLPLYKAKQQT